MTTPADDEARLFRILPDRAQEEAHELVATGKLRDCAAKLGAMSATDRECHYVEMADGLRVTAENAIRIDEAERG